MAAAPAAGAEAGAGLTFSLALFAAFMFVVCIGLKRAWHDTLGSIFYAIGGVGIGVGFGGKIHPFGFLKSAADKVENTLGDLAKGYEQAMGFWFHNAARLQGWIADELWKVTRDSFHFGGWLIHSFVPARIHDATHLLSRTVHTTTRTVVRVEHKTVQIVKTVPKVAEHAAAVSIPQVTAPYVQDWRWLHKHWKALTRAVAAAGAIAAFPPLALPRVFGRLGRLEREAESEGRRLRKVEALLGASVLAAAMANVLGVSSRCLRSGNIGRLSRALCKLDSSFLSNLLGLTAAVAVPLSIVELAEANQKLLPGVIDGLGWLVEEAPSDVFAVADDVLRDAAKLLPGV